MATPREMEGPEGRGFGPEPSTRDTYDPGPEGGIRHESRFGGTGTGYGEHGPELKTLVRNLGQDLSQLAHDELTLAKLELRSVADTLSDDLRNAGRTLVKDLAKVGVALTLGMLAALALTAGAIMAIGALLGAYWAGGLIVGVVLLIAAAVFGMSAAKDLKTSESLRLEPTRRRAGHNKDVMASEARATKQFARQEGKDFKQHASANRSGTGTRH
ncbi:MAG: phage holin family protein [Gemmatimonadetes bacterium]|nr:phage holin family protein [Gemmatimonadota bacterium]